MYTQAAHWAIAGVEPNLCRRINVAPNQTIFTKHCPQKSCSFVSAIKLSQIKPAHSQSTKSVFWGGSCLVSDVLLRSKFVLRKKCQEVTARTQSSTEVPPNSRDEAFEQARVSIKALVGRTLKRDEPMTIRQRSKEKQRRLRVEIPVLDDDASSTAALALDLLQGLFLPRKNSPAVVVLFGDEAASEVAKGKAASTKFDVRVRCKSLEEANESILNDAGALLVVAPEVSQMTALEGLVAGIGTAPVIVINPKWDDAEDIEESANPFENSFEVCYCFQPLAIQGMFNKSEGAVFKFVRGGAPADTPWLLFTKQGDKLRYVSKLKRRPSPSELETVLYQSIAANSPLTKSLQFMKSIVSPK